ARALLLRAFLPITLLVVLANGMLSQLFPDHIRLNPALLSALLALIAAIIISLVVVQTARVIGDRMDRIETERHEAQLSLQKANEELEVRVQERTSELTSANEV